jgi:pimeloyl-ACP methyl ester carboxylesterase
MDYLGQGKSWPKDCNDGDSASERELRYCGTTWVNQIIAFIETVIQKESNNSQTKVHIVGNSVGGHLAVCIAAFRPDLVESLCLLNATPVWGLNLPGWSGHLPAPSIPRKVGRAAFDWIRDPNTIQQYLQAAYCNMEAVDDELIAQIRSCTEGPGGHAAFSSIMWSPPVQVTLKNGEQQATFDDCLRALECDVLLLFGRDDPWCKPAFAKRMLRDLLKRSLVSNDDDDIIITQRYVELQDVGHCPNHEAPVAVATVLSKWLDAKNGRGEGKLVLFPEDEMVTERWGQTVIRERKEEEIPLSLIDRLAITFV